MKAFVVVLVAAFAAFPVLGQRPDNCTNLSVRANVTSPRPGNDLRYCNRDGPQCCSNEYFQYKAMDLRNDRLLNGLREQISENAVILDAISNGLREYIETIFIPRFLRLLEFPLNVTQDLSTYNETIRNNFFIRPRQPNEEEFTVDGFTHSLIRSQFNFIIRMVIEPQVMHNNATPPLNEGRLACVHEQLNALVNRTTKTRIDRSVQQLRLAVEALRRIHMWFDTTFIPSLRMSFTPLDACVNALIQLQCQECVENIPSLCRGVCNSVIYGCYAVIKNGWSGQFNVLWNVTDQLVKISREAVRNVSTVLPNYLILVNFTDLTTNISRVASIARTCGFQLDDSSTQPTPQLRCPNDGDDNMINIPERVSENATNLLRKGLIYYGDQGSVFCRNYVNRNCWNGTAIAGTFIATFTDTTIAGQTNNPFLMSVDLAELQRQTIALGNPVTDFLTNTSFLDVAPQDLNVPQDTPSNSGATGLMMSSFLLVFIIAIFVLFT